MTIQELVYEMRSDGLSLHDIKTTIFAVLDNEGYVVNKYTHLIIEANVKNYDASLKGA